MSNLRLPLRFLGLAIGLIVGITAGNALIVLDDSGQTQATLIAFCLAIGGIGYLLGPHLSRAVFRNLRATIKEASTLDIVSIGVGLSFGALISAALALPLSFLPGAAGTFLPVVAAVMVCAFSIAVVLMRKRDLIAPWVRTRPSKTPASTLPDSTRPGYLLDTSVIIDGRIGDVLATGFLDAPLLVPRFILDELQQVADSGDPGRRARGRRGLETLGKLRAERAEKIVVVEEPVTEEQEVDAKLVALAKRQKLPILTNDYNLHRVAQLRGVRALNFNELANALRPVVLPGEEISLRVVQEGREAGQGVGFLDDGTMVVIDGGRRLVGQQTAVVVTRLLQTGAGRMIFATPKHAASV